MCAAPRVRDASRCRTEKSIMSKMFQKSLKCGLNVFVTRFVRYIR